MLKSSSDQLPMTFSVRLVRRASFHSQLSGSQRSTHYNLKRLSQDFSQIPPISQQWYAKASGKFEVQVSPGSKADSLKLQRRPSEISTSSKLWRDDSSSVDQITQCGASTADELGILKIQNSCQALAQLDNIRIQQLSPALAQPPSRRSSSISSSSHTLNRPRTAPAVSRPTSMVSVRHTYSPSTAVPDASRRSSSISPYRQIYRRPTTAPAMRRPNSVASSYGIYNSYTSSSSPPPAVRRRTSSNHSYNYLPNTRFRMEQNPMGIENLDNKYQKVYPQLPLQHASEPSSASPVRASKFIPVSPTVSQATLPSVYSETTEPSLTLELTEDLTERPAAARHIGIHDMCNRNIEHMSFCCDEQSIIAGTSRLRPLTQCFKRVKTSSWLDKAGKKIQSKTSKLQNLFKRPANSSREQKRRSVKVYPSVKTNSLARTYTVRPR
ncbi:hypothetical protein PCANC_11815 [Puccinia coronata f. sp. avenae]|uniref:Uncharacterized protein n=1 Tax=Puccinia coronata f. sp. avenae TaxID=200324 RepID=A0A2N5T0F6_9BASI|nr:hypothetical protein PCASD_22174 [Puccinia coronata f. sp. avenae]PLW18973.1 hypothetical protein PCANC_11815 [Puccinia coronata f. sp. avenae]PLW50859.1 hypothetical protein PCASD_01119 [Puccinia coronata f. sp. avenae]